MEAIHWPCDKGTHCPFNLPFVYEVVVAGWLRRWTRNLFGFPCADSNPANYEEVIPLVSTGL